MTARVKWNPDEYLARMENAARDGINAVGEELVTIIVETKLSGQVLDVRTGALRQSIHTRTMETGVRTEVGSNLPYARIHEYGGIITPKGGRALAIPIGPQRQQSRTAQFPRPRDVPGLFMLKRSGRPPLLVRRRGKRGGSIEPMFALVPRVTIPARPYLRPALDENLSRLNDTFSRVIRERMGVAQ